MASGTGPGAETVEAFLERVDPARRAEAEELDALFRAATGFRPQVWAGRMLGYGRYAYRYDSGHGGESLATGFAPGKAEMSLYILPGFADLEPLLAGLGPHRRGKSCLYLRRLDGTDRAVLSRLIRAGLDDLATRWTILPE